VLEGLPSLFTRQDIAAALTADYEARLAVLSEEAGQCGMLAKVVS
jgi:hypothetical protein